MPISMQVISTCHSCANASYAHTTSEAMPARVQNMAAADKAGFTERYRALLDALNAKRKAHEAFDFPAEVAAYEQQHGIAELPVFAVRALKQYRGQIICSAPAVWFLPIFAVRRESIVA